MPGSSPAAARLAIPPFPLDRLPFASMLCLIDTGNKPPLLLQPEATFFQRRFPRYRQFTTFFDGT